MSTGVAIVTGSAQGIGRAVALRLAKGGYDIALNDISSQATLLDSVKKEVEEAGRRAVVVSGDISVEADVERVIEESVKGLGEINVVSTRS